MSTTWTFLPRILWMTFASATFLRGEVSSKVPNSSSDVARTLHRPMRSLSFPEDSTMGIFVAVAVPLEQPKSIALSYFFEATYTLPSNWSQLEPWALGARLLAPRRETRRKRSIDRTTIYRVLENKFESAGFSGRGCLLRSICECSEYPLSHNGVIGDIFHVLFTPTSSRQEEELPRDIVSAEMVGRNGSCSQYEALCPVGLFDLIGVLL